MSTLRVDKITPFQSSSIEIDGNITIPGAATTGSNTFTGTQIVTGSVDITGEFLINGTPITGSGGGSVDTSSLATTGSNSFFGDQFINGALAVSSSGNAELKVNNDGSVDIKSTVGCNILGDVSIISGGLNLSGSVEQTIEAVIDGFQTDFVTVSGVVINGKPYDYTNFGLLNYGSSFGASYNNAFAFESYFDNSTYDYGAELKANGQGVTAVVTASGSASTGNIGLIDNYNGGTVGTLQADNIAIGKISGSSQVIGNFVVATVDTLPNGIPGQIAFQGGKMHVYISGQWNEVAFVSSPPPPSSFIYNMIYSDVSAAAACSGEGPSDFYSDVEPLVTGSLLYTGPGLAFTVSNGFYASGSNAYEVSGGAGEITAITACA